MESKILIKIIMGHENSLIKNLLEIAAIVVME